VKSGPKAVVIAAASLAAAGLIAAYLVHIRKDMSDFGVCYRTAGRFMAGETLYRESDGHLQFKYAPAAALFFAPFGSLPPEAAKAAWFVLQIALLGAVFGLAYRFLPARERGPGFVLGWGFLILAKFIGRELELGQVNLVILASLLMMLGSLLRGRQGAAGAFWAASLFLKPYALIFLPYLFLKKKWRAVSVGAGTILAGLAAPIGWYGWRGNLDLLGEWAASLRRSTPGLLDAGDNASLHSFFVKNLGGRPEGLALGLFFGALVLLAILFVDMHVRGKNGLPSPETLEAGFLLLLIPAVSPLGWNYNYLYGLPAVILVLNYFHRLPVLGRWVMVANLFLIGGTLRETFGKTLFDFANRRSLLAANAVLLLAALAALRRRKIA
jgi:hypothetical protein